MKKEFDIRYSFVCTKAMLNELQKIANKETNGNVSDLIRNYLQLRIDQEKNNQGK